MAKFASVRRLEKRIRYKSFIEIHTVVHLELLAPALLKIDTEDYGY